MLSFPVYLDVLWKWKLGNKPTSPYPKVPLKTVDWDLVEIVQCAETAWLILKLKQSLSRKRSIWKYLLHWMLTTHLKAYQIQVTIQRLGKEIFTLKVTRNKHSKYPGISEPVAIHALLMSTPVSVGSPSFTPVVFSIILCRDLLDVASDWLTLANKGSQST